MTDSIRDDLAKLISGAPFPSARSSAKADAILAEFTVSRRSSEYQILRIHNDAAFALYKYEHPESIAESWEWVGLPIVLEYRAKVGVVVAALEAVTR